MKTTLAPGQKQHSGMQQMGETREPMAFDCWADANRLALSYSEKMQRDFSNAVKFFTRAGDIGKDMLARAKVLATHALVWDKVQRAGRADWREREQAAVDAAVDFAAVGLVKDAQRLCKLASSDTTVVRTLIERLGNLDDKWRAQNDRIAAEAEASTNANASAHQKQVEADD